MSLLSRFLNVIRCNRLDRDLDDEIQFPSGARTEDLTRDGMSPQEAREQASRQLGNTLLLRESSRDVKLCPAAGVHLVRMLSSVCGYVEKTRLSPQQPYSLSVWPSALARQLSR